MKCVTIDLFGELMPDLQQKSYRRSLNGINICSAQQIPHCLLVALRLVLPSSWLISK